MTRYTAILPLFLLGASLAVGCGKSSTKKSNEPSVDGCPSQIEEVSRLDWGLDESNQAPIVAGVVAAIETELLLTALEVELTDACGELATHIFAREKDLEPENFQMGMAAQKACLVASQNVEQLTERVGGEIKVSIGRRKCSTAMNAADTCTAACGDSIKATCGGEMQGQCSGVCTGVCASTEGGDCMGRCDGSCDGSCDSGFEGSCRGKCEGTCDGQASKDSCGGTCVGRCLEGARGTCGGACSGQCEGACRVDAAGECSGTCEGQCEGKFDEPGCVGELSLPAEASSCSANCEAALMHSLKCDAPEVKVNIEGASDEDAADQLKRAFSAYLPAVLGAAVLNIDQDRLLALGERTKSAVSAMKEAAAAAAQDEKSKLSEKAQNCIEDKVATYQAALTGLPTILLAADTIRDAAPSEAGMD